LYFCTDSSRCHPVRSGAAHFFLYNVLNLYFDKITEIRRKFYPAKEKIECILNKKDCIFKKIRRANQVKPAYNVFNLKLTYRQLKKSFAKNFAV